MEKPLPAADELFNLLSGAFRCMQEQNILLRSRNLYLEQENERLVAQAPTVYGCTTDENVTVDAKIWQQGASVDALVPWCQVSVVNSPLGEHLETQNHKLRAQRQVLQAYNGFLTTHSMELVSQVQLLIAENERLQARLQRTASTACDEQAGATGSFANDSIQTKACENSEAHIREDAKVSNTVSYDPFSTDGSPPIALNFSTQSPVAGSGEQANHYRTWAADIPSLVARGVPGLEKEANRSEFSRHQVGHVHSTEFQSLSSTMSSAASSLVQAAPASSPSNFEEGTMHAWSMAKNVSHTPTWRSSTLMTFPSSKAADESERPVERNVSMEVNGTLTTVHGVLPGAVEEATRLQPYVKMTDGYALFRHQSDEELLHLPYLHLEHMPRLRYSRLLQCVNDPLFEISMCIIIVLSAALMAADSQYKGLDLGHRIGYPSYGRAASEVWPNFRVWATRFEVGLGSCFACELAVKVIAYRMAFPFYLWNIFDVILVTLWLLETWILTSMDIISPMFLRLVRLAQLVRIARLAKTVQMFHSLHILFGSVLNGLSTLFWSAALLVVIQMIVASFLGNMLEDYIHDSSKPLNKRHEVYGYFGTYARSLVTMFQLLLGDWMEVTRLLMENVDMWWGLYLVLYKLVIGFAVINVISGVFIYETIKVASRDPHVRVLQQLRQTRKNISTMRRLFRPVFYPAEAVGSTVLSRNDWSELMRKVNTQEWWSYFEIEPSTRLFDLLDDGTGQLTIEALASGISYLMKPARHVDVEIVCRTLKPCFSDRHTTGK